MIDYDTGLFTHSKNKFPNYMTIDIGCLWQSLLSLLALQGHMINFFSGTYLIVTCTNKIYFCFQSLLLFTNVIMDSAGIDYHVILAGNLFQQCLDNPGLQQELLCALCKQTSRIMTHSSKHGVQVKKQHSIKHTRVSHYFYLVSSFFCTTEYHSLPY